MASITLPLPQVMPNPRDDAMALHKAFKGFGCDSTTVINILSHRDSSQRSFIQHEYRTLYKSELIKRLSSELSGELKKAVTLWVPDPAGRDATILKQALSGDNIKLKAVTEVICSRTSTQIQQVKHAYNSMFGAYLEHAIEKHASSHHKKLLLACLSAIRYEGPEVDMAIAEQDAGLLYKAGAKRIGTDEKTFIRIFSERSRAHLQAVSVAYHNVYNKTLEKAVKSETSGLFEYGLRTILQCAENPAAFFAKVLHKAMKGLGTDDSTLRRVIVTRAEIDMEHIKDEYYKNHEKSLHDVVQSETSGNYRTFLLALLGDNHH